MTKITKEQFANRKEQNKIEWAILEAIPENAIYHNLLVVLSRLLQRFVYHALDDKLKKWDKAEAVNNAPND